jgi:RHS repeat-associated protein
MKHQNYNVERLDFDQYPDIGVELVPMPAVANASYNYKYNGKELQEELGLNMTAMDFRQYDSTIGRFVGMDRLSELTPSITPYRFAFNSPNIFSDPTGLKEDGWVNTGDTVFWDENVNNQDDVDRLYKGKGYNFNAIGTEVIDANDNTRILEDKGITSFKIEDVLVTGKAKKSTNNSKDYLGLSFSWADVSLGTYNDYLYNHNTYNTTKGIEKNIFKPNGEIRSLQAAKYLKYSKFVKGTAIVGSVASTGYVGYKISNGTATTIDYVDGGVGLSGIIVAIGSGLGYIGATVSNPVGWVAGGYGGIRLLQDMLENYHPEKTGVGVYYDYNIGTYSIK